MNSLSTEQLFLTEAAKVLLNNPEHSPFLNLSRYQLWDIAGIDSLQLMKRLFSEAVAKIAPFQSLDVIFTGYQYSALHLDEGNFRLGLYGELGDYGGLTFEEAIAQAQTGLKVWVRQCAQPNVKDATAYLCAISLTPCCAIAVREPAALDLLSKIVVKSPHSLEGLQRNCAIPVRINGISVLIWRHQLLSQPVFELHVAVGDVEAIALQLINR